MLSELFFCVAVSGRFISFHPLRLWSWTWRVCSHLCSRCHWTLRSLAEVVVVWIGLDANTGSNQTIKQPKLKEFWGRYWDLFWKPAGKHNILLWDLDDLGTRGSHGWDKPEVLVEILSHDNPKYTLACPLQPYQTSWHRLIPLCSASKKMLPNLQAKPAYLSGHQPSQEAQPILS